MDIYDFLKKVKDIEVLDKDHYYDMCSEIYEELLKYYVYHEAFEKPQLLLMNEKTHCSFQIFHRQKVYVVFNIATERDFITLAESFIKKHESILAPFYQKIVGRDASEELLAFSKICGKDFSISRNLEDFFELYVFAHEIQHFVPYNFSKKQSFDEKLTNTTFAELDKAIDYIYSNTDYYDIMKQFEEELHSDKVTILLLFDYYVLKWGDTNPFLITINFLFVFKTLRYFELKNNLAKNHLISLEIREVFIIYFCEYMFNYYLQTLCELYCENQDVAVKLLRHLWGWYEEATLIFNDVINHFYDRLLKKLDFPKKLISQDALFKSEDSYKKLFLSKNGKLKINEIQSFCFAFAESLRSLISFTPFCETTIMVDDKVIKEIESGNLRILMQIEERMKFKKLFKSKIYCKDE